MFIPHNKIFHDPFNICIKIVDILKVRDVMNSMRDHNTNTRLNMTSDVGAGRWIAEFRECPLAWHGPGTDNMNLYINERPIGVPETGWHFVANMRGWLPDHVGGVLWFGVDDVTFSPHIPFYSRAQIPKALATGTGNQKLLEKIT